MLHISESEENELKDTKRYLHQHPEISMKEYKTTEFLKEKLISLGIELQDMGMDTGVVGILRTGKSGPVVGLRADIDAIKCHEMADVKDKSLIEGLMHACGHDFHTTALLGAAKVLSNMKDKLSGDVVFIFQPAEETTSGAAELIKHGLFDKIKIDYIFGLHNRPEIETGKVAVKKGSLMAAKDNFTIVLRGVGGHGGMPHLTIDPIVCGANIINSVQTIVSRNVDPLDAVVVSICSIHGGTPENLIVDEIVMTGSIRALSNKGRDTAKKRLEAIVENTALTYGCKASLSYDGDVPLLHNSEKMYHLAYEAAKRAMGKESVVGTEPCLGSEDFAVYSKFVPTFFYWLGVGKEEGSAPWHNAYFATDDNALKSGALLLAESVIVAQEQNK
ncbi:amidohydrolase family protein [Clostridium argentinense CDC 2741]|uniref:Amidohydrolase family protein n=1 Tax=Clostridium argentinense CDC 2741 TaxID=1418104 RepID=A0A0C1U7P5_9CLOT|nr:M20 family metallopeptidase [Clostridium argentinense]KIE47813.1 amidohydrolase family protein [Clostridium argentinense CDC 2741]